MAILETEIKPGLRVPNNPDAITPVLSDLVTTYLHFVGTCRMGALRDTSAIVDAQCRLIGAEGLRIADASVMPRIPHANTNLATVVIAERCAHFISKS